MAFDLYQASDAGLPQTSQVGQEESSVMGGASAPQPLASAVPGPLSSVQGDAIELAIEEDWVEKAKSIVEKTKNDPFAESNELYKVKTEFLKARYDKQINRAEDHP